MALADEARALTSRSGPACSVGALLADLADADAADLSAALADPTIPARPLLEAIQARGWPLESWQQIGRHRRHECKCAR